MRLNITKYFNEHDYKHSLLRLISFIIAIAAVIFSFILLALNYYNKHIDPNLITLNETMYYIAVGGKAIQKIFETKIGNKDEDN